jgi:class 3 adenylate cyclase
VAFTDLVGSTALASDLGPAQAEAMRRAHFDVVGHAMEAAGGAVVKNLGDGLMLAFDAAASAIEGAVAAQQAVARSNRHATEPLMMRVGLAIGDVTEEEGDFFGEAVVQAARLCAAAEGGHILSAIDLASSRGLPLVDRKARQALDLIA